MTDRLSPERRSWNMSRIGSKNTKPEIVVRSSLHRQGYRFRLHVSSLPGCPDRPPEMENRDCRARMLRHRHRDCRFAYTPKSENVSGPESLRATSSVMPKTKPHSSRSDGVFTPFGNARLTIRVDWRNIFAGYSREERHIRRQSYPCSNQEVSRNAVRHHRWCDLERVTQVRIVHLSTVP